MDRASVLSPHLRLPQLLRGLREVKNVIYDLECEPQVAAVLIHGLLHLCAHTAVCCCTPVCSEGIVGSRYCEKHGVML